MVEIGVTNLSDICLDSVLSEIFGVVYFMYMLFEIFDFRQVPLAFTKMYLFFSKFVFLYRCWLTLINIAIQYIKYYIINIIM